LPSPAATESPSPAIRRSRTWISVETLSTRDADRGDGRLAVGDALLDGFGARRVDLLRRDGAVVKAPVAGRALRHCADESHDDRVRLRREIVFALAIALAGFEQDARGVDAQMRQNVLCPAAAARRAFKLMLGGKLAAGTGRSGVPLEVGAALEQAEAVLDLPVDVNAGLFGLSEGRSGKGREGKEGGKRRNGQSAHLGPQFEAAHLVTRIRQNWERSGYQIGPETVM
jgi:hypothetical protein